MKFFKVKKVISMVLAVVMVFSAVAVNSIAATSSPLFEMTDAIVDLGEEFEVSIKFARDISDTSDPIAALDVSLEYNENVYDYVSMEIGQGLQNAFDATGSGDTSFDKGDYSYGVGTEVPGVIKWSLITLDSFTFVKGEEFMKLKFKVAEFADVANEDNLNLVVKVTNAAEPNTLKNITNKFTPYTNNMKFKTELDTKCEWVYVESMNGYRLADYNGSSEVFAIPDVFDDLTDDRGPLPVVSVGTGAFRGNTNIKEIVLGKNVTDISIAAFMSCSNLSKLVVYSPSVKFGVLSLKGVSDDFVIKCIRGSEVDDYAKSNGIAVEYFDEVADCTIVGTDEELYYTGVPVEFSQIVVTGADGVELTYGIDYTVSYKNNIEIGTAELLISGNGDYVGEKVIEFEVLCPHHNEKSGYYTETVVYNNCTEGGKIVKACAYCGYHDDSETVPAKEHGECSWVVINDSTCAAEGESHYVCADCTTTIDTKVIEKKSHIKSEEWSTLKDPECTQDGLKVIYCQNCTYIYETEIIPQLGHSYVKTELLAPTCAEKGLEADICSVCGDKTNEAEKDTLPHNMQWIVITEPECGVEGEKAYKCFDCGYSDGSVENEPVDALVCTPGDWVVIKDVTCTEDGERIKSCIYCGEIMETEAIIHEGHKPNEEWTVITELTCTQNGYDALLCSVCDEPLDEKRTTAQGHVEDRTETVDPTCTEPGSVDHYCLNCGEVYQQDPIGATGHTDGEWRTVEPKCTQEGAENHHCGTCDEIIESKPIPMTGHDDGEWTVTVDGGCENDTVKELLCTKCGESLQKETIPGPGHVPEFVPDKLPTYNSQGKDKVVCSTCETIIGYAPTRKVTADVNGDKKVSSMDALMILQHSTGIVELEGDSLRNADLDGSGTINSTDALLTLQLSTGIISA